MCGLRWLISSIMSNSKIVKNKFKTLQNVLDECPDLVYIQDPVLREKTLEVDLKRGVVIGRHLISVLQTYRKVTGIGRGLAAPQIGVSAAVFVTYVNDLYKIYINPRIIKKSSKFNLYKEGCLSCAPMWADVKRPSSISIEYTDEFGNFTMEDADGFLARLLQHEYDHLEGVVNLDIAEAGTIEMMLTDPLEEKLREINL